MHVHHAVIPQPPRRRRFLSRLRVCRRRERDPYRGGYRLVALGGDWSHPIPDATVEALLRQLRAQGAPMTPDQAQAHYEPPHLRDLVRSISYKPGWLFTLAYQVEDDGSGGLQLQIVSDTDNSLDFSRRIRVRHSFLVPPASYNRDTWAAWIFDRIRDVETHEAGEFFRIDGVREFAPHHGNGEDPYRVWHVSDWATAAKSAGDT